MRRLGSPTYVSSGNYSTQITPSVPIDQLGYRIPSSLRSISYWKAPFVDDMTKTLRKMSLKEHHSFTIRTPPLALHAPFGAGETDETSREEQSEYNEGNHLFFAKDALCLLQPTLSSPLRL